MGGVGYILGYWGWSCVGCFVIGIPFVFGFLQEDEHLLVYLQGDFEQLGFREYRNGVEEG